MFVGCSHHGSLQLSHSSSRKLGKKNNLQSGVPASHLKPRCRLPASVGRLWSCCDCCWLFLTALHPRAPSQQSTRRAPPPLLCWFSLISAAITTPTGMWWEVCVCVRVCVSLRIKQEWENVKNSRETRGKQSVCRRGGRAGGSLKRCSSVQSLLPGPTSARCASSHSKTLHVRVERKE